MKFNQETDGVLYKVDTMNSRIEWKGYKVLKSDQTTHFGVKNLKVEMLP